MQIYYWCPFLTNIATIEAVKRSAVAMKKYSSVKESINVKILNSFGEWSFFKNNLDGVEIHDTQKLNLFSLLPKTGIVKSRITFLIVLILNFLPLINLISKKKPNYLIIHLLTILPIILSPILSKNTKIILRISGLPKLTPLRKFVWKFFSKYINLVTVPSRLTGQYLINNNIFNKNKIKLLRDPVIDCKKINTLKSKIDEKNFTDEAYYLAVGRLTAQKNFHFLIKSFAKNIDKFSIKKLLILGDGEEIENLIKLIETLGATKFISILGFKHNIYNYLNNSQGLISTALYEDPGFALIEAAFLKKKIITSLVPNGPIEMHNHDKKMCFFFESNNENDFVEKIINSEKTTNDKKILISAIKFARQFGLFTHFKNLKKLIC